jgi:hypothetical protein
MIGTHYHDMSPQQSSGVGGRNIYIYIYIYIYKPIIVVHLQNF